MLLQVIWESATLLTSKCNLHIHFFTYNILPRKNSTSINLDAANQQFYKRNSTAVFFLLDFGDFSMIDINNNFCCIAQNILSKEIKQVLQSKGRGTAVTMELQTKAKWFIMKSLL